MWISSIISLNGVLTSVLIGHACQVCEDPVDYNVATFADSLEEKPVDYNFATFVDRLEKDPVDYKLATLVDSLEEDPWNIF